MTTDVDKCDCCGRDHYDDEYIYHATFGGVLCYICASRHIHNTTDKLQLIKISGKGIVPLNVLTIDVTVENIQYIKECKERLTKAHSCSYIIKYIEISNKIGLI